MRCAYNELKTQYMTNQAYGRGSKLRNVYVAPPSERVYSCYIWVLP